MKRQYFVYHAVVCRDQLDLTIDTPPFYYHALRKNTPLVAILRMMRLRFAIGFDWVKEKWCPYIGVIAALLEFVRSARCACQRYRLKRIVLLHNQPGSKIVDPLRGYHNIKIARRTTSAIEERKCLRTGHDRPGVSQHTPEACRILEPPVEK